MEHAMTRRAVIGAGIGLAAGGALARAQAGSASKPGASAPAAVPSPGPFGRQRIGHYTFKVGSIECVSMTDGFGAAPLRPLFAPEAGDEEFARVMRENDHSVDTARFEFNVLAARVGGGVVLFDAGYGVAAGAMGGKIAHGLGDAGISRESVTAIVLSHAHPDHIQGALDATGQPAFPNARVFVNKTEHDFWMGANPDLSGAKVAPEARAGMVAGAQKALGALKGKLELVAPGDKVLGAIELVDAAGHTPGHMAAILSDADERLFITGDLAHNYVVMVARPEWTIGFDADPKRAAATRARLFESAYWERWRLYAYHMPWPGIGRLDEKKPGYRWRAEAWAWE